MILFVASCSYAQEFRIYCIDVGQGGATLFVTPSGRTLLVDSGGEGKDDVIRTVMAQAGVTSIDHFVVTHYHSDHYGGIPGLVAAPSIPVGMFHDRGDKAFLPASRLTSPTYIAYQNAGGEGAHHLMRGETIQLDPAVTALCVASGGAVLGEPDTHSTGEDENDMSIALLVQFEGFQFFVGGDIERQTELDLARVDGVMNVDVYQANHHGSASSSCFAFLKDLQPSIVIISNGDNSTYKHPRQVTLDTLAILDSPPLVIQTNKLLKGSPGGNVADRFIADLESTDDDGTIVIKAEKSTKTISISYRDTVISRPWKNQGSGPDSSAPRLVIESLLADPAGNDRDLEEVTIRNAGTHAVQMANWFLRDRQGRVWALSSIGSIPGGASRTVIRSGMAMSLDNDGDEVFLFDPANVLRDRFEYGSVQTNIRTATGH